MKPRPYCVHDVFREDRTDGTIFLSARARLGPVDMRTTDWLERWARAAPERVFVAERSGAGWRETTYAEVRDNARAIAGGLLDLGLGPDQPLMILSGNSVDHAVLSLAAQYVGVPVVPVAEQLSQLPGARAQLTAIIDLIKPGMVYADNGIEFGEVLLHPSFGNAHRVVSSGEQFIRLQDLTRNNTDIFTQHSNVGPESVAKILITSESTAAPKGVQTTHRMMCSNQTQLAQVLPFLRDCPPVLLDWLPWDHVFGGSQNFNMVLANGGSLYIDQGKPVPHLISKTLENIRMIPATLALNVPAGFAMLRDAMRNDAILRHAYFEKLEMLYFAGASLPHDIRTDLETMAREVGGDAPLFTSSWGLAETAPAVLWQHQPTSRSEGVGVPLPGTEVKLVPADDARFEIRVKGPNVFDGYFNDPDSTDTAFDEDGYFLTGDAMCFVDPENMNLGLKFDGRISDDFTLASGVWVDATGLRGKLKDALGAIAHDVVITGEARHDIGVLIVPKMRIRQLDGLTDDGNALVSEALAEQISDALITLNERLQCRVVRAMILSQPPYLPAGEVSAKGTLNPQKLLEHRAALVNRLYDDDDPSTILIPQG